MTDTTLCSSHLLTQGIGSWFAYILPSALVTFFFLRRLSEQPLVLILLTSLVMSVVSPSCICISYLCFSVEDLLRVILLRRKARPTETELQVQYSHMINEALEMIAVEPRTGDSADSVIPSIQTDDTLAEP